MQDYQLLETIYPDLDCMTDLDELIAVSTYEFSSNMGISPLFSAYFYFYIEDCIFNCKEELLNDIYQHIQTMYAYVPNNIQQQVYEFGNLINIAIINIQNIKNPSAEKKQQKIEWFYSNNSFTEEMDIVAASYLKEIILRFTSDSPENQDFNLKILFSKTEELNKVQMSLLERLFGIKVSVYEEIENKKLIFPLYQSEQKEIQYHHYQLILNQEVSPPTVRFASSMTYLKRTSLLDSQKAYYCFLQKIEKEKQQEHNALKVEIQKNQKLFFQQEKIRQDEELPKLNQEEQHLDEQISSQMKRKQKNQEKGDNIARQKYDLENNCNYLQQFIEELQNVKKVQKI